MATDRERCQPIERAFRCWRAVQGRDEVRLDALGHQFRVNPRTVRRYLMAAQRAGLPVPRFYELNTGR